MQVERRTQYCTCESSKAVFAGGGGDGGVNADAGSLRAGSAGVEGDGEVGAGEEGAVKGGTRGVGRTEGEGSGTGE